MVMSCLHWAAGEKNAPSLPQAFARLVSADPAAKTLLDGARVPEARVAVAVASSRERGHPSATRFGAHDTQRAHTAAVGGRATPRRGDEPPLPPPSPVPRVRPARGSRRTARGCWCSRRSAMGASTRGSSTRSRTRSTAAPEAKASLLSARRASGSETRATSAGRRGSRRCSPRRAPRRSASWRPGSEPLAHDVASPRRRAKANEKGGRALRARSDLERSSGRARHSSRDQSAVCVSSAAQLLFLAPVHVPDECVLFIFACCAFVESLLWRTVSSVGVPNAVRARVLQQSRCGLVRCAVLRCLPRGVKMLALRAPTTPDVHSARAGIPRFGVVCRRPPPPPPIITALTRGKNKKKNAQHQKHPPKNEREKYPQKAPKHPNKRKNAPVLLSSSRAKKNALLQKALFCW